MRLTDLKPQWVVFGPNSDGATWVRGFSHRCPNTGKPHLIEFRPVIGPEPVRADSAQGMLDQPLSPGQPLWTRAAGETFEALSLTPSLARPCCHFTVTAGEVVRG